METLLRRTFGCTIVPVLVLILSSCYYYGDPVYVSPGGHHGGGGGYGNSNRAYRQGAQYGHRDARNGQSMQPSRYWHLISSDDRVAFSQGYNDAYSQSQSGGAAPDPNAYNQGASYGRQDARRGLTMQPSRYWHLISTQSRIPFSQGYNDAYQRAR